MSGHEIEKPNVELKELISLPTCSHHWIIETPDGPTSKGICKLCREEREFSNQLRPNNPMSSGWSNQKEANENNEQADKELK